LSFLERPDPVTGVDPGTETAGPGESDRKAWMAVLAKAPADALAARLDALAGPPPVAEMLRGPETGTVMVRGRAGGTGAAFNLGEMTVTRATLRLADGTVGHATVQGRDHAHARRAALADAMLQGPRAGEVAREVVAPLAQAAAAQAAARAAKAAGTRVEFFTLARGEDA
jgi:alpha-D-ribose 1-methylphosphonate 5-triphosphate synthase subunit PhnG